MTPSRISCSRRCATSSAATRSRKSELGPQVRTLIVGAGAIGGYFGARLIDAGRVVTFLVRPRRAEQLRRDGLAVVSPLGNLNLPTPSLVTTQELKDHYDLVIASSKSYDLEASIQDFAPAVGPNSWVLPLLNGM